MTCVLLLTLAMTDAALKVEAAERDPPVELATEVRGQLDGRAIVVSDGDGPSVTVWFRTVLTLEATAEVVANGVGYRELAAGTLVGAVKLHQPLTDFRKQRIAAGVYTLRFAVQPEVGDHAGTSPHPEFLLLSPAADDESAGVVEPKDLLARSRKATGGNHPAVMLLMPAGGATESPKLVERAGGLRVLTVRRPAVADGVKTTLNVGLVVSGVSQSR